MRASGHIYSWNLIHSQKLHSSITVLADHGTACLSARQRPDIMGFFFKSYFNREKKENISLHISEGFVFQWNTIKR